MGMSKHTPGEWTAWQAPDGSWAVRTVYQDEQDRRTTTWPAVCNAGGQPNEANARLIAAAPDMLEALKEAAEAFKPYDRFKVDVDAMRKIEAAIAKAEGRS